MDWAVALLVLTLILVAMLMAIGAAGVPGGVIPLLYVVMVTVGIPEAVVAVRAEEDAVDVEPHGRLGVLARGGSDGGVVEPRGVKVGCVRR